MWRVREKSVNEFFQSKFCANYLAETVVFTVPVVG